METLTEPHRQNSAQYDRYKQLYTKNQPKDQIRILVLEAGGLSEPLKGRLITVSLADKPRYNALSYVWGDPTLSSELLCDGERLLVTESLRIALVRIRGLGGIHHLWADAICINQNDLDERAHQVKMMQQIYSSAEAVIVWLGEPDISNRQALEMLHWVSVTLPFGWYHQQKQEWPRHIANLLARQDKTKSDWMTVIAFGKLPWFDRIWPVQEIVKARQSLVLFRESATNWALLSAAVDFITATNTQLCEFLNVPQKTMSKFSQCYDIVLLQRLRDEPQRLLRALHLTSNRKSSNPRDRVYGVLGLVDEALVNRIEVNYASEYSAQRMMRDVAIRTIQHEGKLDFLSPSSLRLSKCEPTPQKPSWVFDWISAWPESPPTVLDDTIYFTASGNTILEFDFCEDDSVLVLTGRIVDIVAQVGAPPDKAQQDTTDQSIRVQESFAIAFGDPPPSPFVLENPSHPQIKSYISALLAGATELTTNGSPKREVSALSESLLQGALNAVKVALNSETAIPDPQTPHVGYFFDLRTRRFCKTRDGRLGLVPQGAKVNDVLAVLHGGKTPFLLRPRSDGYYQWLGEVYVQGLMMGEAMEIEDLHTQRVMIK